MKKILFTIIALVITFLPLTASAVTTVPLYKNGTYEYIPYTGDSLGVGLTAPQAKLHVSGACIIGATAIFNITGNGDGNCKLGGNLETNGDEYLGVGNTTESSMSLYNSSGSRRTILQADGGVYGFKIDTSSNGTFQDVLLIPSGNGTVMIGTTTASSKLSVDGGINFAGDLKVKGSAGTSGQVLTSAGAGVVPTWSAVSSGNSAFTLGNGFIFNATSTDNVGIGSSSPAARLGVLGSSTVATSPVVMVSTTTRQIMTILTNGFMGLGSTTPSNTLVVVAPQLENTIPALYISKNNAGLGTNNVLEYGRAALVIDNPNATPQSELLFRGNNTDLGGVRVDQNGTFNWEGLGAGSNQSHVFFCGGIGTQNACGTFSINANGTAYGLTAGGSSKPRAASILDANGLALIANLGLGGTTTAATPLAVLGNAAIDSTAATTIALTSRGTGGRGYLITAGDSTLSGLGLGGKFSIRDNSLVRMVIESTGLVGFGGNTATAGLSVTGSTSNPTTDIFNAASSSGTSFFKVLANGNVGVGTTSAVQTLDVNGGIRQDTSTAEPTCDATVRGTHWFVKSAAGVKDRFEVCAKDAGDAYAWRVIY